MIPISMGHDSETATGCRIEGMKFHDDYFYNEIQCKVRKACDYIKDEDIKVIDFVKIIEIIAILKD